jgi:hypothetical protein
VLQGPHSCKSSLRGRIWPPRGAKQPCAFWGTFPAISDLENAKGRLERRARMAYKQPWAAPGPLSTQDAPQHAPKLFKGAHSASERRKAAMRLSGHLSGHFRPRKQQGRAGAFHGVCRHLNEALGCKDALGQCLPGPRRGLQSRHFYFFFFFFFFFCALDRAWAGPKAAASDRWQRLGSGARGKGRRLGRRQRHRGAGDGLGRGRVGRGVGWAEGSGIGARAMAWVGGAWEGEKAGPKAAAMGCWQRLGSGTRRKGRGLDRRQRHRGTGKG